MSFYNRMIMESTVLVLLPVAPSSRSHCDPTKIKQQTKAKRNLFRVVCVRVWRLPLVPLRHKARAGVDRIPFTVIATVRSYTGIATVPPTPEDTKYF